MIKRFWHGVYSSLLPVVDFWVFTLLWWWLS